MYDDRDFPSAPLKVRVVSWNVGGINGNGRKLKLKNWLSSLPYCPDIVAIQEHKLGDFMLAGLAKNILPSHKILGKAGPGGGGSALLVHNSFTILENGAWPDGTLTWACLKKGGQVLHVASIYAPNTSHNRQIFWARLQAELPIREWILCGDWNSVEHSEDTSGTRNIITGSEEVTFRALKLKLNLSDAFDIVVSKQGPRYTRWRKYGNDVQWSRIDKVLLGLGGRWLTSIDQLEHHAGTTLSDHFPISLQLSLGLETSPIPMSNTAYFKFSSLQVNKPQNLEALRGIWNSTLCSSKDPRLIYVSGWKRCRQYMRVKQKEAKQQLTRISELEEAIKKAHESYSSLPSAAIREEIHTLEEEKRILEHERDVQIRIWSRVKHLGVGDAPTKYFFNLHRAKCARSQISELKLADGTTTHNQATILLEAGRYYENLYRAEPRSTQQAAARATMMGNVRRRLSAAEQAMLSEVPSLQEIEEIVMLLPHNKAPGPDGVSAEVMHSLWPILKMGYYAMVKKFWETKVLASSTQEGAVKLIPKSISRLMLKDWRPLTMLNIDYKIIAKLLASRLQLVLPKLVMPQQTGFVKGRNMYDNILSLWLTQDLAKQRRMEGVFIKLDFEKAFDRVDHDYLWDTMEALGLGDTFIALIKGLTIGATAAVHLNGCSTYHFNLERGVRQGCPLAPLLFAISTEPLMVSLNSAYDKGTIQGMKFGKTRVDFSLFADDMGVFIANDSDSFIKLRECIAEYELASGSRLNIEKSCALPMGCTNPPGWLIDAGCKILKQGEIGRHLGAPFGWNITKSQMLSFALNRMKDQITRLRTEYLSFEAKLILLKHTIRAIPIFWMSLIGLNQATAAECDSMCLHFLWGWNATGKAKIALIAWKKLCRPKVQGGMGFKDLRSMGKSLLCKKVADIMCKVPSTWSSLLAEFINFARAKYDKAVVRGEYSLRELLLTGHKLHTSDSHTANALGGAWASIRPHLQWTPVKTLYPRKITLRDSVNLVLNNLEEGSEDTKKVMATLRAFKITTIAALLQKRSTLHGNFVAGKINKEKLSTRDPVAIYLSHMLQSWPPATIDLADSSGWQWVDKGSWKGFAIPVTEFYSRLSPIDSASTDLSRKWQHTEDEATWQRRWSLLWGSILTMKDKIFWWRLLHQGLYTSVRAATLGHGEGNCPRCHSELETFNHIFLQCIRVKDAWTQIPRAVSPGNILGTEQSQLLNLFDQIFCCGDEKAHQCILVTEILRAIWLSRNHELYEHSTKMVSVIACIRLAIEKQAALYKEQRNSQSAEKRLLAAVRLIIVLDPEDRTRLQRWLMEEASSNSRTSRPTTARTATTAEGPS